MIPNQYKNEGVKFDKRKLRYDLIPPSTLHALATVLTYGAEKYEDRNWEKGIHYDRIFGALNRHLWAWWSGEDIDPESNLPHIWHVLCNIAFIIHFDANKMSNLDNRYIEAEDLTYKQITFNTFNKDE